MLDGSSFNEDARKSAIKCALRCMRPGLPSHASEQKSSGKVAIGQINVITLGSKDNTLAHLKNNYPAMLIESVAEKIKAAGARVVVVDPTTTRRYANGHQRHPGILAPEYREQHGPVRRNRTTCARHSSADDASHHGDRQSRARVRTKVSQRVFGSRMHTGQRPRS